MNYLITRLALVRGCLLAYQPADGDGIMARIYHEWQCEERELIAKLEKERKVNAETR